MIKAQARSPFALRRRPTSRAIVALLISLVVSIVGVYFTAATIAPLVPVGWRLPVALFVQIVLFFAQFNLREKFGRESDGLAVYAVLFGLDILLNKAGLLLTYGAVEDLGQVVPFVIGAAWSGQDSGKVVASLIAAVVIAVLPEQLLRDNWATIEQKG